MPPSGAVCDAFDVILPFESEHIAPITWDHLLRQTDEWEDRHSLSDESVTMALTLTWVQIGYGFMNWYLTSGESQAFFHRVPVRVRSTSIPTTTSSS